MFLEAIIVTAIVGIFIVIVRHLPAAIQEHRDAQHKDNNQIHQAINQQLDRSKVGDKSESWWDKLFFRFRRVDPNSANPDTSESLASNNSKRNHKDAYGVSGETLLTEGDKYLKNGELDQAERAYLRAVAKDQHNPKVYNRLGVVYLKQQNFRDALEAFEAARNLDSGRASRHYNVALAAWELKDLAKARAAIAQTIRLDPESDKYQQLKALIDQV